MSERDYSELAWLLRSRPKWLRHQTICEWLVRTSDIHPEPCKRCQDKLDSFMAGIDDLAREIGASFEEFGANVGGQK